MKVRIVVSIFYSLKTIIKIKIVIAIMIDSIFHFPFQLVRQGWQNVQMHCPHNLLPNC